VKIIWSQKWTWKKYKKCFCIANKIFIFFLREWFLQMLIEKRRFKTKNPKTQLSTITIAAWGFLCCYLENSYRSQQTKNHRKIFFSSFYASICRQESRDVIMDERWQIFYDFCICVGEKNENLFMNLSRGAIKIRECDFYLNFLAVCWYLIFLFEFNSNLIF
jgi:hypothetical protein